MGALNSATNHQGSQYKKRFRGYKLTLNNDMA